MLTVECVRRDDSGQEVLHMTLDITEEGDGEVSRKWVASRVVEVHREDSTIWPEQAIWQC